MLTCHPNTLQLPVRPGIGSWRSATQHMCLPNQGRTDMQEYVDGSRSPGSQVSAQYPCAKALVKAGVEYTAQARG